jgi:hypothetical protein
MYVYFWVNSVYNNQVPKWYSELLGTVIVEGSKMEPLDFDLKLCFQ